MATDKLVIGGREFTSRLMVGTGKYASFEQMAQAIELSGAEIVTVAVRRVNVSDPTATMLTDFIDPKKFTYLPNTAGCFDADSAVRTLRLAREAGGWDLVKLEVLAVAVLASVTVTTTLLEPITIGVPEMAPLPGVKLSPVGKLPLLTATVSGLLPPPAVTVAL